MGKPLPRLEGIKFKISTEQTKRRAFLICFFDMEQRPSRPCINQLAKQMKELKEKNITIIAIQASKIDENQLNE